VKKVKKKFLTPNDVQRIADVERNNLLQIQKEQYDFILTLPEVVVNSQSVAKQVIKQIGADADIQIMKITGTFQEFDGNGDPLTANFTDDIRCQIKDAEGDTLTDFVRLSTVLSPGRVGNPLYKPFPFRRTVKKSNNLEFNFIYGNTNVDYTCKVNLTFYGRKIKNYK
jgi:hypothetical protein